MKLYAEAKKNRRVTRPFSIDWSQAKTYMIESQAEYDEFRKKLIADGFVEIKNKTSALAWMKNKKTYNEQRNFDWWSIYTYEWKDHQNIFTKFIFSQKDSRKNDRTLDNSGAAAWMIGTKRFKDMYGVNWIKNFGRIKDDKELWDDCCISPINYCNKDFLGQVITNVRKNDVSSAYPYACTKKLPTYTGHKKVSGYAEPTKEFPFAFYMKSHHLKVLDEFDTRTFLKRGRIVDYKNVNSETKIDRWAVEIPDEEEITILMKQSEISLEDFWNETYDAKQKGDNDAKLLMNAMIGFAHSRKNNKRCYCPYVAAVAIARHVDRMLTIISDIKDVIYMVLTDCIIYNGKLSKHSSNEKYLGAFYDEIQTENSEFFYTGTGQYAISTDGRVKTVKYQGIKDVKKEDSNISRVQDLVKITKPKLDLFRR